MSSTRLLSLRTALSSRTTVRPAKAPFQTRGYATKQPSASSLFYRQFTRPVAKVLLMAVLTYQVAYWSWVKLETDEIRAERDDLETKVNDYKKSKVGLKDSTTEKR